MICGQVKLMLKLTHDIKRDANHIRNLLYDKHPYNIYRFPVLRFAEMIGMKINSNLPLSRESKLDVLVYLCESIGYQAQTKVKESHCFFFTREVIKYPARELALELMIPSHVLAYYVYYTPGSTIDGFKTTCDLFDVTEIQMYYAMRKNNLTI